MPVDREHALTFARFLWTRFVEDKCFETAGALSYTTLFALVPLTATVFGILSAFPVFSVWTDELIDFIFSNFVPTTGMTVRDYLLGFADNAKSMTAVSIVVLVVSALMMMWGIEDRLNRIWRVEKYRTSMSRFMLYWTALTLGPILVVAGIAATSYVFAQPWISSAAAEFGLHSVLLRCLPFVVTFISLLVIYELIPNRRVALRYGAVGALLGAILFELSRWGFALYVSQVANYQQIYGALAVIPIFLIWIYLSWVIVLLGASVAASLSSFDYRPVAERLPAGAEFIGLMHVLKYFVAAQRRGELVSIDEVFHRERFLSDDLLQRYINDLHRSGLIEHSDGGDWMLVRSPDTAGLASVYETGRYHLPLDSGVLQQWSDGLPTNLQNLLDNTIRLLRERLDTRLGTVFPDAGAPDRLPNLDADDVDNHSGETT